MNGVCHLNKAMGDKGIRQVDHVVVVVRILLGDGTVSNGDDPGAAFGEGCGEGDKLVCYKSLLGAEKRLGRGDLDAVFRRERADLDGLKNMGIFTHNGTAPYK